MSGSNTKERKRKTSWCSKEIERERERELFFHYSLVGGNQYQIESPLEHKIEFRDNACMPGQPKSIF